MVYCASAWVFNLQYVHVAAKRNSDFSYACVVKENTVEGVQKT